METSAKEPRTTFYHLRQPQVKQILTELLSYSFQKGVSLDHETNSIFTVYNKSKQWIILIQSHLLINL